MALERFAVFIDVDALRADRRDGLRGRLVVGLQQLLMP
jgi:hypothetical protein